MHFALHYEVQTPSLADIIGPPPSAGKLATRAAVNIALIHRALDPLTPPGPNGYRIEWRSHPGARILSVH